eukprot:5185097-Pyramimonas_sp.AAC.1
MYFLRHHAGVLRLPMDIPRNPTARLRIPTDVPREHADVHADATALHRTPMGILRTSEAILLLPKVFLWAPMN